MSQAIATGNDWHNKSGTTSEADSTFSREEHATLDLAKSLRTETEDANPFADQPSLWADLMGAALAEVNWHEIAEQLIQDVQDVLVKHKQG